MKKLIVSSQSKLAFLDVAAVKDLHQQQIERFGGAHGLRDEGLLSSAVMRAENVADYVPDATVPSIAASLGFGLIKNHAFLDGNKRIGLVSTVVFLRYNGFVLAASQPEQIRVVQRVAASQMSEAEWTAWVERFAQAI